VEKEKVTDNSQSHETLGAGEKAPIDQKVAEIKDCINVLESDLTKSIKLSDDMQFVIFDLSYYIIKAIEIYDKVYSLGFAYDMAIEISRIAKELGDYDVMRDAEKVKSKILQFVELIRDMGEKNE
jgi:hypothetical protein